VTVRKAHKGHEEKGARIRESGGQGRRGVDERIEGSRFGSCRGDLAKFVSAGRKAANVVDQAAPANVSTCVSLPASQADEEPQNGTLERISRAVVSGSRLLTPILAFLALERIARDH
jgi:hypothetical protein